MSLSSTCRVNANALTSIFSAHGFCRTCNAVHGLPLGAAHGHCLKLIHHFRQYGTIDLRPGGDSDPRLSTAYLFGPARGKMFGALECLDREGRSVMLHAFSGQYDGLWQIEGWAPPLFDPQEFAAVNDPAEARIKQLGRELDGLEPQSDQWLAVKHRRRDMSRELMRKLHSLYRLTTFHGCIGTLASAVFDTGGIPTGTGDCCAPKLLNQAARLGLTPISIAEFYWGLDNLSATRRHGRFYPSCREKCQPILGFMLCGAARSLGYGR